MHDDVGGPAEPRWLEADEPGRVHLGENLGVLAPVSPEAMQSITGTDDGPRPARHKGSAFELQGPDHVVGCVDDEIVEIFAPSDDRVLGSSSISEPSSSTLQANFVLIGRSRRRRRNRRTACLRRGRRRRSAPSRRRPREACGSRCGAGRLGDSGVSNRPRARRAAAARCRPP